MKLSYFTYQTKIGDITIQADESFLHSVSFGAGESLEGSREENSLIKKCILQIEEYLDGNRKLFDLPMNPKGTEFQKKVWKALLEIPYGETRSYGEIARRIGTPGGSRAVGMANNKNPLAIIVPCHRVIGADGRLVGYGGGLPRKEKLLELERR
ncbi:MAG: methylated-DNA--[protein]-cysteine S-methyltransferase [Clostridiales bacterium]|nr:methylated-DNA--[protein]-cysteine S-methyltransferase [Clostridiales bacterium]